MLRVLVVSAGDPASVAIVAQLDRVGVPYTLVKIEEGRPVIDGAFLADASTGTANFQAVALPNQAGGGLGTDELAALAIYESTYGVRQLDGYDYPGTSFGLGTPLFSGSLDGSAATVTEPGLAGPFSYLKGSFGIDNFDPAVIETHGSLAAPGAGLTAEQTFTPLVTATVGEVTGSIVGVYGHDGREEMMVSAAYNSSMQWFNELAPGIVTWLTRGIYLGYQRNYFSVHIDDVLLADGRWSVDGNCTPGDDCMDPTTTTTDIRMVPADVTRLIEWQNANAFKLTMVYNGGGSEAWKVDYKQASDPLADALVAVQAQLPWVNHTSTHPFLGCIQIAPTAPAKTWHCATNPNEAPRQDSTILQTLDNGIYWASQAFLTSQIAVNAAWGTEHELTDFDPKELVTGEHSGLNTLPQQPADNPFLAPALTATGVRYTASDASREPAARTLGTATTVPRHPMNVYYNTATYLEAIDEYNWYYTSVATGGSGICTANPQTSTCIEPLEAGDADKAKASFDTYLQPLEVRNALRYILTNDPAPFYAHQSNLAEDGVLYPVAKGVLDTYKAVYNEATTPVLNLDMTGLGQASSAMSTWRASPGVAAYVDAAGVHLPAGSTAVPLTVPLGTVVTGATLSAYAGQLSGWVNGPALTVPPAPAGESPPLTEPTAPGAGSPEVTVQRIFGADRYETSAAIARVTFGAETTPGVKAVIANGGGFADAAMGANLLSGYFGPGPVLLTRAHVLPRAIVDVLRQLRITQPQIFGGTGAVDLSVQRQLQALVDGYGASGEVGRYTGIDRYATAAAVARSAFDPESNVIGVLDGKRTAFLASGASASDALAAAPLAYAVHGPPVAGKLPLLLTNPDVLSAPTRDALVSIGAGGQGGIEQVIVIGGPGAVRPAVLTQIRALGISTRRIEGVDRQGTAVAVASFAISTLGWSAAKVNLTRGDDFADAASSGPHAGQERAPLLFTLNPGQLGSATAEFLRTHAGTIHNIDVLGGPGAVTDRVVDQAVAAAGG